MDDKNRGSYSALTSLHRLEFILQHKSDALLRHDIGVGFGQVQIMQVLSGPTPISQRAIAQKLYQTEANISRQLQLLKKKGLVNINRHPKDKRLRQISLTSKGTNTYQKAKKTLANQHKHLLKLLSTNELKQFDQTVSRLLQSL